MWELTSMAGPPGVMLGGPAGSALGLPGGAGLPPLVAPVQNGLLPNTSSAPSPPRLMKGLPRRMGAGTVIPGSPHHPGQWGPPPCPVSDSLAEASAEFMPIGIGLAPGDTGPIRTCTPVREGSILGPTSI